MTVDLHTHSTASDGELSPHQLIGAAGAAGLTVLALTDHDTVAGVPEAVSAGETFGVEVVSGCEFSVGVSWGEMHLLGYFLPVAGGGLAGFLKEQREARSWRAQEIVKRLQSLGVAVEFAAVQRIAGGAAIGRPHVARALVEVGAVSGINPAFDRYLGFKKPAFVPKRLPRLTEVTRLVKSVGGVTSAAHLKDRASIDNLRELKAAGVDAIEAIHPSHGAMQRDRIAAAARKHGFLTTGGSDWHGPTAAYDGGGLGEVGVPHEWLGELTSLHGARLEEIERTRESPPGAPSLESE